MSSEPTTRATLAPTLLLKFAVAGALSLGVVMLVPRTVSGGGDVPPVRMLIETAVIVSVICALALFWGIRSDLRLPVKVGLYAVLFNTLVIVVKLALAPHGFYDVNQTRNLTSGFEIDDSLAAVAAASLIFLLYAVVYVLLYRFFRGRIAHIAVADPVPRIPRGLAIALVVLFLLGIGSGGAILILLLPLFGGLDYLDFVFSSGVSLLVALALAAATAFAALAFDATSKRAHALGDATMYMSFFWVGLYFLALYHVLWVVYVLVLTSIWPLKVVTPK
ncbi:MAG: hypothetical protein E6G50_10990 [Actinobacteria bacterium]|nr:MAG: hypothetical protein E6G50_10990 [Actinomycetota bacterium]